MVRSCWNCETVKPLYLIPAIRWQFSSWCLTVSIVSSFFVRLIAERMVRLVGLLVRWIVVVEWWRRGLWKWDLKVDDDDGCRNDEDGRVERVDSIFSFLGDF